MNKINVRQFFPTIKLTVWLFLLCELMDGITTIIGLSVGGIEGNILVYKIGWFGLISIKILASLMVACFIQFRIKYRWMEWLLVIAGGLVVPWNIITIFRYLLAK